MDMIRCNTTNNYIVLAWCLWIRNLRWGVRVWSSVNLYGSHAGICANVSPSFAIWYSPLMPLSSSGILCWGMAIALHISGVNIVLMRSPQTLTLQQLHCTVASCSVCNFWTWIASWFLNIMSPKKPFFKLYSIPRRDMLLLSWSHSLVLALRPRNLPNCFLPLFLQLI